MMVMTWLMVRIRKVLSLLSCSSHNKIIESVSLRLNTSFPASITTPFLFRVLPKDLCLHILIDWLGSMKDLALLDIAICNRWCRRDYHQVLAGKLAYGTNSGMDSPDFIQWLYVRGMCANHFYQLVVPELPRFLHCCSVFHTVKVLWITNHRTIYPLSACTPSQSLVPAHLSSNIMYFMSHLSSVQCLHLLGLDELTMQAVVNGGQHLAITTLEISDILTSQRESIFLQMMKQWGWSLANISIYKSYGYSDRSLEAIAKYCPQLQTLSFACNRCAITSSGISKHIPHLSNLRNLCISDGTQYNTNHNMFRRLLPHLKVLKTLKVLCENDMNSIVPCAINSCPLIESIEINMLKIHMPIKGDGIIHYTASFARYVPRCCFPRPIRVIKIQPTSGRVTSAQLQRLLQVIGRDVRVFEHDHNHLDEELVQKVFEHCPWLTGFHSRRAKLKSSCEGIVQSMKICGDTLTDLTLRNWQGLQDHDIKNLVQQCSHLEQVEIVQCTSISSQAFANLLQHCRKLHKLVLGNCQITSRGIAEALCANSEHHKLTNFELVGVTKQFCEQVQKYCQDWANNPNVTAVRR